MDYDTRVGRYGCDYHNGYWEAYFDGKRYTYLKAPPGLEVNVGLIRQCSYGMGRYTWHYLDSPDDPHIETDY